MASGNFCYNNVVNQIGAVLGMMTICFGNALIFRSAFQNFRNLDDIANIKIAMNNIDNDLEENSLNDAAIERGRSR